MQDIMTEIQTKLKILGNLPPELKRIALRSKNPLIFNPTSQDKLDEFEKKFDVVLPDEFKWFYIIVSNGCTNGAGPDEGLFTIEEIEQKLDQKKVRERFYLTKPWSDRPTERRISRKEVLPGTIPLSAFGEGIETFLVINGRMAGTVWSDDRGYRSDNAVIYPLTGGSTRFKNLPMLSFLEWYLDWIESCLERVQNYSVKKEQTLSQISADTKELTLKGLHLTHLPELPKSMPNLITVDLSGNNFESLKGFPQNTPNLQEMVLNNCGLTDLQTFPQNLPNLVYLSLGDLKIKNLLGLPLSLPKLQRFWAAGTSLETLNGFPIDIAELRGIKLSFSKIKNLYFLPNSIPNLEVLELRACNMESLDGFPSEMPKLQILDLRKATINRPETIPEWVKPFIKR
jgi:hypothetical protein